MCPQCYLGVTLKFSVVPQRSCCENWGWEEAGAEQEAPRVAGSRWDQASAALEIHRRSSQTTMDRPNTSGGDLRGEAAQGGWNPAWMGWGVAEPLTHPAPLAPQPRPERCRSLSRPRAARHGHRSHRRGSQCHTHHPATHAWKGSCPQPSVLTPSLAQGGLGASVAVGSPGAAVGSGMCCWRPGRSWGAASEENSYGVEGKDLMGAQVGARPAQLG